MRSNRSISILILSVALMMSGCKTFNNFTSGGRPSADVSPDVIIEHVGGSQILAGTIHKRRGDRVRIEVRKTENLCYAFNFLQKVDVGPQPAASAVDFADTVAFETTFLGRSAADRN